MSVLHSSTEPFMEEDSTEHEKSSSRRPRCALTIAVPSSTCPTTPPARLPPDRPYRTSTITHDSNLNANKNNKSPNAPESLAASRHADVQLSTKPIGSPRALTTITTTAAATATSNSVAPSSVRGKNGSTTQYRVYQPSSLFGTNTTPAASFSLSSSQVLTDATTTNKPMTPMLTSERNTSALTAHGETAEEELEKSLFMLPRRFLDVTAGPEHTREGLGGSARLVAGPFGGSSCVTSRTSLEKNDSAVSSNNSSSVGVARRGAGVASGGGRSALSSTTLRAVRIAANADATTVTNAAAAAALTTSLENYFSTSPSDATVSPPQEESGEMRREELADKLEMRSSGLPARVGASKKWLDKCEKGTTQVAHRRHRSCRLDAQEDSSGRLNPDTNRNPSKPRESKGKEGDSTRLASSSSIDYVAVPESVQVVLKNAKATKEELWTALLTACQQCELLQRQLSKTERRMVAESNVEAKDTAAATAAGSSASLRDRAEAERSGSKNCSGGNAAEHHENRNNNSSSVENSNNGAECNRGHEQHKLTPHTEANGVGSAASKENSTRTTGSAQASGAGQHANNPDGSHNTRTPSTTTNQPSEVGQKTRAQGSMSAMPTTPASALSVFELLRTHTAASGPSTSPASSPAPGNTDASSVLCSRIAEEIRRVEATRKEQQRHEHQHPQKQNNNPPPVESSLPRRSGKQRKEIDKKGNEDHPSRSNSFDSSKETSHISLTIKARDEALLGKRKVREAVVKSREADPWPSLTSPSSFSRELYLMSYAAESDDEMNRTEEMVNENVDENNDSGEEEIRWLRKHRHHNSGSPGATSNGGGSRRDRIGFRRHASNVSDTASLKSENGFALPSLPYASMETFRKASFTSRSHNSGRLPQPRPPSSSTSESVAASGMIRSSTSPQQVYHRRLRGASSASVESEPNHREGSATSCDRGGGGPNESITGPMGHGPPIFANTSTSATTVNNNTLPALMNEEALTLPSSGRAPHLLTPTESESVRARHNGSGHYEHRKDAAPQVNWLARGGSPASPSNGGAPSIPSLSSPLQKSIVSCNSLRSSGYAAAGAGGSTSAEMDLTRNRIPKHPQPLPLHRHTASHAQEPDSRGADGCVFSPLQSTHETAPLASLGSVTCTSGHTRLSTAAPSILEMVRLVAEEDTPVSLPANKNAELREWRRQAAKIGMRDAPATY